MKPAHFCCLILLVSSCRREEPPKTVAIAGDGALALTLATFNVRYENPDEQDWRAWPNRIDRVVRSIRSIDPDLLGIQEALHGQAADLWASLPGYDLHGVGREDGKRAGEYTAILFRRDRFEKLDGGTVWLSDHPSQPGSATWGNSYPRVVAWLHLGDRSCGRNFYVFNTHWDHQSQYSREKSAVLLGSLIDARDHPDEPVILLGDFNATGGNPAVDYLTGAPATLAGTRLARREHPLVDTYHQLHPEVMNRRTLHFWRGHRDGWAKVDHILVSRGGEVEAAGIRVEATRELQPSDHFPVWAKVRWQ